MPPVFAHGRLRLYLLKLLDEAPRHGYEVIRLLEERFQGLYAPSAGTVYPRLSKLEAEGLVTHATEGGRKVYSITDAGRTELDSRSGELADLELEIRDSVAELAAEIRDDVRGAAGDLRREVRAAAGQARTAASSAPTGGADWKEEFRRARQEWKEQTRRAKDESRRAREDAQHARRQAQEAQERLQDAARRVQDQVQDHFARGDWPKGVQEGLSALTRELGGLGGLGGAPKGWGAGPRAGDDVDVDLRRTDTAPADPPATAPADAVPTPAEPAADPAWSTDLPPSGDPARDLERLLDRFRDDIRDAARDSGVSPAQLDEARRHLSAAAAHIVAALRAPRV
ncbi:helix-turn-helix transcriptional regulator [Streptomyces sp. NPDC060194]|uniref:PadR family transcriptional regulator n=1 Tax=Streptomyces sp. NPDC060194 TaxID=3347069 RepID=UPI0036541B8C